jgi:hypothetical protein
MLSFGTIVVSLLVQWTNLRSRRLTDCEREFEFCRRSQPEARGRGPRARSMNLGSHLQFTGRALKNWLIAQFEDSLAVGALWLVGLYGARIPWAPLWAGLAAILQFVPHLGPVLGLIGPVLAAALCGNRAGRRFRTAAFYHEADGQGADVGFDLGPLAPGYCHPLLGSAHCASGVGRVLCLPLAKALGGALMGHLRAILGSRLCRFRFWAFLRWFVVSAPGGPKEIQS